MKKNYLILLLFVMAMFSQTMSFGQLLLHESFSYPLPATVGGNGATGTSANNWTTHSVTAGQTTTDTLVAGSLSFPGLQTSAGEKLRLFSYANTISRDINRAITTTATVCYYSALINIVDNSQIGAVTPDYFMHFGASSGGSVTSFGARLGIKSVNTGANYRYSILNASTGTNVWTEFAQDLNFGQTYLVVVKYDRSTVPTTVTLWVDPVSTSFGGTEPVGSVMNNNNTSTFLAFGSICLRNNAVTPKAEIDEIRVGETWADVTPPSAANIPVTSISVAGLAGATTITTNGGTLQMVETVLPVTATNQAVTWSVSNGTGSANISAGGLLSAVNNGTVTVRATANDGSGVFGEAIITLSNQNILVTGITVTGFGGATTITTLAGTLQMSAAILPVNATDQTVTWSVINGTGTASIDASGLLTAISDGTVTVKATANDISGVFGTLVITLSNQTPPVLVTSITVTGAGNATTITTNGGTLQMSAAVLPANATNPAYTWSVVNGTGTASIDAAGLLTAITNGVVTVKATANDASATVGTLDITISNQIVLVTNITVTGAGSATTITTPLGTLQMSAAILPVDATNQTVTWSVINGTGQATIDAGGLLTASANGIVTVKATANDASGVFGVLDITISNQLAPPSELLYEPFNYPVGDTLPMHSWVGLNGGDQIFVTTGGLSYPNLGPSNGEKVSFNGAGRDFQRTFTSQAAGTVYYSFVMQVTDLGTLDSIGGYFTGIAGSTTLFGSSVWTKKAGADYLIGFNPRTTLANTLWSSVPCAINTPVFVVVSYELVAGAANDITNIWINPASTTFGAVTAPTPTITVTNAGTDLSAVDRVFVRQDSDIETPFIDQDEIRVGLDWATVTPLLVGLSAVENKSNEIKVYPNPTLGMITLNSGNQNSKEIRVYSNTGSLVFKTTTNNVSEVINLSDRSAGLYMIQVVDQVTGKQSNIKVQVQ